jgi:isoleucyl-tRNA synthetase
VRLIQQARKEADLKVSDRINLTLQIDKEQAAAAMAHESYIKDQTLALKIDIAEVAGATHDSRCELDGKDVIIGIDVAA